MKAISLLQPWAHLMVHGHKTQETRAYPRSYKGILLIHASKGFPKASKDLCATWPFSEYLTRLHFGAIIGAVEMTGCVPSEKRLKEMYSFKPERQEIELCFGDYSPGRFVYPTQNPIVFPEPIPCKGNQAVPWNYDEELPKDIETLIKETYVQ